MNATPREPNHIVRATIIWVVLSVIGLAVVFALSPNMAAWGLLPPVASARVDDINKVLLLFTALSVPVFMMVVVYAGYSVFTFRGRGRPEGAGPAMHGNRSLQISWLAVSLVLVVALYAYGLYFLNAVDAAPAGNALQIKVTGEQWLWNYDYPQYHDASGTSLVLPVNRPVEFTITSIDVQHSFWIPAMGIKQDAVPGMITHISVTPTVIGDYAVRCAELCGLYHAYMNSPVKVVSDADFQTWISSQTSAQGLRAPGGALPIAVVGDMIAGRSSAWQEG